ncbi:hypothetical protein MTR67_047048 [Solanum verrucosum]|uniref:Uncharacterized protein n=1 Tax=Solanum verrucosum TaxID=315347 RepID=A0AAF0UV67_SOLVR|nr:hypothetical protein MTR67_047048 [Solanum verrucosum]
MFFSRFFFFCRSNHWFEYQVEVSVSTHRLNRCLSRSVEKAAATATGLPPLVLQWRQEGERKLLNADGVWECE